MGAETGEGSPLEQEIEDYITKNYSVDQKNIYKLVKKMESMQKKEYLSLRGLTALEHVGLALRIANEEGLWEHPSSDRHIPTILAATWQFESNAEKRALPLSSYVKVLAVAEMETAKRGVYRLGIRKEDSSIEHAQRAIELIGFYQELNK